MSILEVDPASYRQVLGQFPTGVVVVTSVDEGGKPLGMTVGSFTAVSLEPPLVAFLPSQSSSSWAALRTAGDTFCINVLSAAQESLCRVVATRKSDKFEGVEWRPTRQGNPAIVDSVAWIDCHLEAVHDAGDHHIVIGRVVEMAVQNASYPLLFFRGGYGSFVPTSLAAGDVDLSGHLRAIDLARPQMESLADRLETEVTASCLIGDELVLAAAAGHIPTATVPTRVGQRVPFIAPLGSVFAAWGDEGARRRWAEPYEATLSPAELEEFEEAARQVRSRGVALSLGNRLTSELAILSAKWREHAPRLAAHSIARELSSVATFNPVVFDDIAVDQVESVAVPVFRPDGRLAFAMTAWGPFKDSRVDSLSALVEELKSSAAAATSAIMVASTD